MPFNLDLSSRGRAWGKTRAARAVDRYEAAIRLERVRQQIRENLRYGFPITNTHMIEMQAAGREYVAATDAARY